MRGGLVGCVLVMVLTLAVGACSSPEDSEAAPPDPVEESMCVAMVRVGARLQVDAARRSVGDEPRFYANDGEIMADYREALPARFADQLELVTDPDASPEDLEAASAELEQLLAEQCGLGADIESPLTDGCERDGVKVARSVASGHDAEDESSAFAEDCVPPDNPFSELSATCQGIVYSHYVRPSIDGEFSAGFPSTDDDDAIASAFVDKCDQ